MTPEKMGPLPPEDDDEPEVTRDVVEAQRRAAEKAKREVLRESKTRRSWYTSTAAADAFTAAVDDIHFATRVPKHEVVAALMMVAVEKAPTVQKRLTRRAQV
jgi:hypothetical protein